MSGRSEARVARQLATQLKQQEKKARILASPDSQVVRSEYAKTIPRQVRAGANPGSIYGLQVTWTCSEADRVGAWDSGTPRDWTDPTWQDVIQPKLAEFAKLTWAEVERMVSDSGHRMHHPMETTRITDEAQYRMLEIEKHADTIYRFRLGNLPRLWGFRVVAEFQVLWYDPLHEVYPVG